MSITEDRAKERAESRARRVPLGTSRRKLTVENVPPGYKPRWINDTTGRIGAALEAGYMFLTDNGNLFVGEDAQNGNSDVGGKVSRVVGKDDAGGPIRAFLMAIPEDLYEEDQKDKQVQLDATDKAIKEGSLTEDADSSRYVPKRGINYTP